MIVRHEGSLRDIALAGLNGEGGSVPRFLHIAQLRNLPAPRPLISSLVDLDTIALLYGRRGSHKSFLALDWALHVAQGRRWHTQAVETATVVYVCAEGHHGLAQRIDAWQAHHGITDDTANLLVLPEPVNLLSPSSAGQFADLCAEVDARLIVLDTLARCTVGGDENSAKDMGLAVEQLDVIRRRTGACVMPVHHAGKSLDGGARGSSALEAAADTVLELSVTDEIITLRTTKQKHHPEGNPWRLRACPNAASIVLDLYHATTSALPAGAVETLAALASIEVPGGVSTGAWKGAACSESRLPESTFYRHRKTLLTLGLLSQHGEGNQARYQVSDAGTLTLSQGSHDFR